MSAPKKHKPVASVKSTKPARERSQADFSFFNKIAAKRSFHLLALAIFFVISLIYCSPVLKGLKLNAGDSTQGNAFNREFVQYQNEGVKEFIGWTNTMFSGMPRTGSSLDNFNYPYKIVHLGLTLFGTISFEQLIWLMIGVYILLLALGVSRWLSIIGAICFSLTTFNITSIEAGHALKIFAIACVSPILGGMIYISKKEYLKGFIVFTVFLFFMLTINHTQITYYTIMASVIMGVFYLVKMIIDKDFKHLLVSGALLLGGAGLCGLGNLQLVNFYNMSKETMRGGMSDLEKPADGSVQKDKGLDKDYALAWSYGINESMTFLIPNFMGGPSQSSVLENKDGETYTALASSGDPDPNQYLQATTAYWGSQPFTGGPTYFGILTMLLFVIGLMLTDKFRMAYLLTIGVLFLFMSWGKNFMTFTDILFNDLPMYNKFRTPGMAHSIIQVSIFAFAFLGLQKLLCKDISIEKKLNAFYIGGGIIGGLVLISWLMPTLFGNFLSPNDAQLPDWLQAGLAADRKSILKKDALRSLGFLVVGSAAIWAFLQNKLSKVYVFPALCLLMIIDLWSVDRRYLNNDDFKKTSELPQNQQPSPVDQQIMADKDPHYRVFNVFGGNPFNDANTSFFHESVGGYSASKLMRYQELIENHLSKGNLAVFAMLNTKYFIQQGQDGSPALAQNPDACGNAWFVDSLVPVNTSKDEMDGLNGIQPKRKALIEKDEMGSIKQQVFAKDSSDKIALTSYLPHKMEYTSSSKAPEFAVFSEIFYKQSDGDGWIARIDGKETPIYRVDYLLRGIEMPAGIHKIEMEMVEPAARQRSTISVASLFLLTLLWIGGIFWLLKKKTEIPLS